MFIEITRKHDETKIMVNVHRIDVVEPLKQDGYGREQTGCLVYFDYTGNGNAKSTKVAETYMQVLTAIEAVTGKEVGTIGRQI